MNKAELIDAVVEKTNLSKADAARSVDAVLDTIVDTVKRGDAVALTGFGTFERKHRAERKGRNPQTGAEITIEASDVPGFKAGKAFKDAVAGA